MFELTERLTSDGVPVLIVDISRLSGAVSNKPVLVVSDGYDVSAVKVVCVYQLSNRRRRSEGIK